MPAARSSPSSHSPSLTVAVTRPELLAPAGDWECAKAAVENGADAIYFGLDRFNARMRARNFTAADLPELMAFLHRRGVRGYVTFNTLVFQNEWREAEEYIETLITAGVDAAIVQDAGICRLIRTLSPDFPIHCSTQMTITSAAGVRFARKLGAQLVVLARETSLKEIAAIRASFPGGGAGACLPLEVFVHGALCVAYSGQCLTSESLGGRSANRGECAQACRMPYDLVSDGKPVDLAGRRYLLSPQDLAGLDVLADLVRSGVASLKIEGRLKSPEYVANITRVYRQALDRILPAIAGAGSEPQVIEEIRRDYRYDLEMGFSRGLHTGWFRGIDNRQLVHARFGTKRGVLLGRVRDVLKDGVLLRPEAALKPGDGVVFDAGRPEDGEQGGRIYAVERRGEETLLRFGRDAIDFSRIQAGNLLWKTNDPELDRRLRQSFAGESPRYQRPVSAEVFGAEGTPLTLWLRDEAGRLAEASSTLPLVRAEKNPLSREVLERQLGRLGGTPFRLAELRDRIEPGLMLPVSELNRLRREAAGRLEALRAAPLRWTLSPRRPAAGAAQSDAAASPAGEAELIAVIRRLEQLPAVLALPEIRTVYCEFENPKRYRDAVERFRQAPEAVPGRTIWAVPPRIFKEGESWILKQVRSCEADGYLVRNHDHLEYFSDCRRRGDFPLNIANRAAAEYFVREYGLERVTASYDLNLEQLEALLAAAPPRWFEITLHQRMPMFHMEHCVYCAFLSDGTDYTNCGRPCDRHEVAVRDRVGADHPLKADAGCRNTVYNARAQSGAEFASRLVARGARAFRIEFLNESPPEVSGILKRYLDLLNGKVSGAELWREFKLISQLGVTRGGIAKA